MQHVNCLGYLGEAGYIRNNHKVKPTTFLGKILKRKCFSCDSTKENVNIHASLPTTWHIGN